MALLSAVNNTQTTTDARRGRKETLGYLNFTVPNKNGKDRTLGTINLDSSPHMATLVEWLKEDPSRAELLMARAKVTFKVAGEIDESAGFDLNF